MSTCKTCGREVRWAQRENGRTHPPLDYVGPVLVVIDNVVRDLSGYKRHVCQEEDIAQWETQVRQETALRAEYQDNVRAANEAARKVVCRKCGSDVNVPCKNITERNRGNDVDTVWPHNERLEDVGWSSK